MNDDYMPEEGSGGEINNPQVDLEDAIGQPDLSSIESKDPSLLDGYKIIYNKEVPLDIKLNTNEGPKDIASFEKLYCKILSDAVNPEGTPTRVKFELSWESNLTFHYTNIVDEQKFLDMKKKQNLNIDFPQYCNLVTKICDDCINSPDIFIGVFTIKKDGISQLQFIKGSDFKFLELLLLDFTNSSDDIIQKHMLYRFAYLKSKLNYNKKALKAAGDVILECNPEIMNPILDNNDNYLLDVNKFFGNKMVE